MEHTKGPWTFVDGKYKPGDQRFTVECESNVPGMPGIIAKVGFKPNAHLIAAAPDLLEHGYILAILSLQSDRYRDEPEFRDAVDNLLTVCGRAKGEE